MFWLGVLIRVGLKLFYSFNVYDLNVYIFIFIFVFVDIEYKLIIYKERL